MEGMFPEGYFYILSRKHGFALDVYDGGTSEGTNLIVWPQKFQDSDNQLWSFEGGRLTNKKSGHVMDISSSAFKKDKTIVQKKRKANKQSQEWIYDQGFICSKEYPSLVLDIRGDSPKGGAQVLLYKRKDTDNLNQLWQFEPYQQFENALNMVTTAQPLHKKDTFGQPSLGYAAEVGVPPELKAIPENNNIAGVGKNASATPSSNGPVDNSRIDPALAQYGSFYGGTPTSPPAAQPGQKPVSSQYPPPPSKSTNEGYPPPPQAGPAPSSSSNSYPPPPPGGNSGYGAPPSYPPTQQQGGAYPPANNSNSGYPPPPISPSNYQQQHPVSGSGYPPAPSSPNYQQQRPVSGSGYPPAPASPNYQQQQSAYPPATGYPPQPSNSSGYPPAPSSPSNYLNNSSSGYPPASNTGYPPSNSQLSTSPPSYPPSYPPASNTGYPPTSPGYPQPGGNGGGNLYQQQPGGMPSGYPPSGGNPPPMPGSRPQQDQYGYPQP
ncbi:unnamed protein product [Mucor hiemalis]